MATSAAQPGIRGKAERLMGSTAGKTARAENYVGLPFDPGFKVTLPMGRAAARLLLWPTVFPGAGIDGFKPNSRLV